MPYDFIDFLKSKSGIIRKEENIDKDSKDNNYSKDSQDKEREKILEDVAVTVQ